MRSTVHALIAAQRDDLAQAIQDLLKGPESGTVSAEIVDVSKLASYLALSRGDVIVCATAEDLIAAVEVLEATGAILPVVWAGPSANGAASNVHSRSLRVVQAERDGESLLSTVLRAADASVSRRTDQRSRSRAQALFENSPFGKAFISSTGAIGNVNGALSRMINATSDGLVGTDIRTWIHKDDVSIFHERFQQIMNRMIDRFVLPCRFQRDLVEPLPVQLTVTAVDRSGASEYLIVAEDLSDRRRVEDHLAHRQKMEALGQLAGGVAHDINNFLTIVTMCAENLVEQFGSPAGPSRNPVDEILEACKRAKTLIRQLVVFGDRQHASPVVLDLREALGGVEKLLRRLVGENIELTVQFDDEIGMIWADAGHLEQVLFNLVVNARDAMPKAGKVSIECANVDGCPSELEDAPQGPCVVLRVRDTGCGIDPRIRDRIFEPFFSTKRTGRGTGLGLSTVYGIVRKCHGAIHVSSKRGCGTTMEIYFPRVTKGLPVPPAAEDPVAPATADCSETILVVEDDDVVRRSTVQLLETRGFRVMEARNGPEAINLCEEFEGKIDLLLADVVLPRMSGPALLEKLLLQRRDLRAIFISGYDADTIAESVGHVTFLPKPFNANTLVQRIREVQDRGRPRSLQPAYRAPASSST